ncbi:transcription elongation factor GreA [Candidatus Wolfebacteria bacterium]|nr:transcription elongation factor GreA [Candidatus Wolfebacteria bacterium]
MKHYLSKERLEELKKELQILKSRERQEIAERLKRAKEYGDLSENSEYTDAKEAQSKLESRILEMEAVIRNAVIIKKNKDGSVVSVGSTVEVQKGNKNSTYTIVGSNEAMPEMNSISNESPLGKAFLDKKVGDIVDVEIPSGKVKYKIIKID